MTELKFNEDDIKTFVPKDRMQRKLGFALRDAAFKFFKKHEKTLQRGQKSTLKDAIKPARPGRPGKLTGLLKQFWQRELPDFKTWNKGDDIFRADLHDRRKFGITQREFNNTGEVDLNKTTVPKHKARYIPKAYRRGPVRPIVFTQPLRTGGTGHFALKGGKRSKTPYLIKVSGPLRNSESTDLPPFNFLATAISKDEPLFQKELDKTMERMIRETNAGK